MELALFISYSFGVIIAAYIHAPNFIQKKESTDYPCTEITTWIIMSVTSWIAVLPFVIDLAKILKQKQDNEDY
jgi:uncharacterized membrane protein